MKTEDLDFPERKVLRLSLRIAGTLCILASCFLLVVAKDMYGPGLSEASAVVTAGVDTNSLKKIAENIPIVNIRSVSSIEKGLSLIHI